MKCNICGKEFSRTVYPVHIKRCRQELEETKEEYTVEELRGLAKENGIKTYWKKSEQTLIDELKEKEVI